MCGAKLAVAADFEAGGCLPFAPGRVRVRFRRVRQPQLLGVAQDISRVGSCLLGDCRRLEHLLMDMFLVAVEDHGREAGGKEGQRQPPALDKERLAREKFYSRAQIAAR